MAKDSSTDTQFLSDAQKVVAAVGGDRFCTWVEKWTGQAFQNKPETILRNIRDRKTGDDRDDKIIRRFIYQSDTGRLALGKFEFGHPDVTEITAAIKAPDATETTRKVFNGIYLGYHASYVLKDRYVVRAFEFASNPDGIGVRDFLIEELTADSPQELRGAGAVAIHDNRAAIFLRRTDNAVGFKAIIISQVQPGDNGWMAGQMIGLNRRNELFTRVIILRRFLKTIEEAKSKTGIFPHTQLEKDTGMGLVLKTAKAFEHTVNNQDWLHALAWPSPYQT